MIDCGLYTLTEIVERYCIAQFNDQRKGFTNYMVFAKAVWNEVLNKTLKSFLSVMLNPIQESSGQVFIQMPKNIENIFGIYYLDDCGNKVQVFKSHKSILRQKPNPKKCGCKSDCGCDSACTSAHDLQLTVSMVEIEGEEYTVKQWVKVLNSGDVVKHRSVPTWDVDTETVVYVEHSETLCKLEVKDCGCVKETKENISLLIGCGCYNSYGIVVLSGKTAEQTIQFEGTKGYLIGGKIREAYLLDYQERNASECSLIPEIAVNAVMAGIDYHSKMYNPRVNPNDKQIAKNHYKDVRNQIILDLNKIDLDWVSHFSSKPKNIL